MCVGGCELKGAWVFEGRCRCVGGCMLGGDCALKERCMGCMPGGGCILTGERNGGRPPFILVGIGLEGGGPLLWLEKDGLEVFPTEETEPALEIVRVRE